MPDESSTSEPNPAFQQSERIQADATEMAGNSTIGSSNASLFESSNRPNSSDLNSSDLNSTSLSSSSLNLSSLDRSRMNRSEMNDLEQRVAELQQQEKALRQEISSLQASYNTMLQRQIAEAQTAIGQLMQDSLSELEQRRQTLQLTVEQLERRQERIRNEMRTTFAGASQDLAIRVQGFKDYLVGSLQDLATAAEQLQLVPPTANEPSRSGKSASPVADDRRDERRDDRRMEEDAVPPFTEQRFQDQTKRIRKLIDQYRTSPDYYGPPWQLRRTFEPIHAERVSNWFFTQSGRGALRTMGSRLQNILIASAIISILRDLHGERLRTLVLGNSPERLGEWRRGLQDCLGVSRADFGSEEGIVLFEDPEPLAQRADRLLKQKQIPLIIVDEAEVVMDIALLQFPLWLAYAPDPMNPPMMY
jgi:chaperonin cofactor prefoldin